MQTAQIEAPLVVTWLKRIDKVAVVVLAILAAVAIFDMPQFVTSLRFVGNSIQNTFVFLFISVGLAAYAKATGADNLIARAFQGPVYVAIVAAALMGALSPFCSCGVIPVIVALLAIGVPLAPVMAFWLASPLMDPSMFVMTAGTLGWDFAVAKTIAAVGVGLLGGIGVLILQRTGMIGAAILREGVGNGGCAGARIRNPKAVTWRFWTESARVGMLIESFKTNAVFLGKWLILAFVLESLMVAYTPNNLIAEIAGGTGPWPIVLATLIGIPSYLNGYAALPLVKGLLEQGLASGAAMAFLIGGGVTSVPAAMAVAAVATRRVFVAYLALAVLGAVLSGMAYAVWAN